MPKGMLGNSETLREFISGPVTDLLVKANGEDADTWQREFAKFLRKEPTWQTGPAVQSRERPKLLEYIATEPVTATKRFVADSHFVVDTSEEAGVKIACLWETFRTNFATKVETGIPAGRLRLHRLLQDSTDTSIIAELGPAHETYLADLWKKLRQQRGGEPGYLSLDEPGNIFYIRDVYGVLQSVYVSWAACYGGWTIGARPVTYLPPWRYDLRISSR